MNSKVIKWFKRQASIRRYSSDKPEDKTPSNSTSEEKKKHHFPRLSFRKRNRRKEGKGTEFDDSSAVIGISKKFSLSVPKEMESNTKEPVTKVPNSNSVSLGCSLTSSPNRTDGFSGASDFSYHSSLDYSKENTNESLSVSESEAAKPILTSKEVSEMSEPSNYDNLSFHPVSSSIHANNNKTYLDLGRKTVTKIENAPIVKMDDICDIISDKEHPEEMQSSSTSDSAKGLQNNSPFETSENVDPSSYASDKIYEDLCDRSLEEHLTKENCEETDVFIEGEMESCNYHIDNKIEKETKIDVFEEIEKETKIDVFEKIEKETKIDVFEEIEKETKIDVFEEIEKETKIDVFEEIDRLVKAATSVADVNIVVECDIHQNENKPVEEYLRINEAIPNGNEKENSSKNSEEPKFSKSTNENNAVLSLDGSSDSRFISTEALTAEVMKGDQNIDDVKVMEGDQKIDEVNYCNDTVNDTLPKTQDSPQKLEIVEEPEACSDNQIKDSIENDIVEPPEAEKEVELVIKEEADFENVNIITKDDAAGDKENNHISKNDSPTPVQIVLIKSSPVKQSESAKSFTESSSKSFTDLYPEELNPFGEDSDSADGNESLRNKRVNPNVLKSLLRKENDASSFRRETKNNFNGSARNVKESSSSPVRNILTTHDSSKACTKSLNPFGDSDDNEDEGVSSLNSTNPFDEDDQGDDSPSRIVRETRPRLPPKSSDLQSRKNSRGSLAPIPIPRRSKQSHHGSYTSLQNVSTAPIPAPRSITPFGSTKTLNFSANPFEDDEAESSFGEFERRSVGRSSMQVLPTSISLEPLSLSRNGVRGSLPPSVVKLGKKKRPAPLPPGFSQRKLYPSLTDFNSLPRKRSSTSPAYDVGNFDKKASTSREISPHRTPPPRPPPPKLNI